MPHAFNAAVAGDPALQPTLGYLVALSANNFDSAGMFAAITLIGVVADLMFGLLRLMESTATRWEATI